jgi:murein DD-endopeptidase MepM/ murein hydrolase activator NlpD
LSRKKRRYSFNTETLSFDEVKKTPAHKLISSLVTILYINVGAVLILFFLLAFVDSPESRFQEALVGRYNQKYQYLAYKVDSINVLLQQNNYQNDQLYRVILEMDSIPENMRFAGSGGYDPYASVRDNNSSKAFNLMLRVNNLKRQLGFQEQSYEEILTAALDKNIKIKHFPGITPVNMTPNIRFSSFFGARYDPFTMHRKAHTGVDFVGPLNTEIHATADGFVTLINQSRKGYGNEIVIDHKFGHKTRYAHLNSILVKEGQKIERGQVIGLMGNTGKSTGTHLHYEVLYHDTPIDPFYFFADDLQPEEFEQLAKKTD